MLLVLCLLYIAVYNYYSKSFYYSINFLILVELDITLGEILAFITGADRIPAMGFKHGISVYFDHVSDMKYPQVSTCLPSITIPQSMTDFDIFLVDFVEAIKGSSVCFGRP